MVCVFIFSPVLGENETVTAMADEWQWNETWETQAWLRVLEQSDSVSKCEMPAVVAFHLHLFTS